MPEQLEKIERLADRLDHIAESYRQLATMCRDEKASLAFVNTVEAAGIMVDSSLEPTSALLSILLED